MTTTNINQLYDTVRHSSFPLSLSDIVDKHPDFSKRSIQRWLSKLVQSNKISVTGEARARLYHVNTELSDHANDSQLTTVNTDTDNFPAYIPLHPNSKTILQYIEQPTGARAPVGYRREFLEAYQPNITFYLTLPQRRQLRRMGDTQLGTLPAGTYGREVLSRLLIDLSWASSHLEGNTYSRLDTIKLIEQGKAADGKGDMETQMILNHKAAIELLIDNAADIGFNRYSLFNIHCALSENLLPNPADEGRIRQHNVEIGKSVYRPIYGDAQIGEILDEILAKADLIKDPFEQSFFIMVHLPYLQPFADVNKRTSRLAANLPLITANLCPLTFIDVPEQAYSRATLSVYELNQIELLRDVYLWAYQRSTQEYLAVKQHLSTPDPFRLKYGQQIKLAVNAVVVQLADDPSPVIFSTLEQQGINRQHPQVEYIHAQVLEELLRLHQGVLMRYGLKPSQLAAYQARQQ